MHHDVPELLQLLERFLVRSPVVPYDSDYPPTAAAYRS
jgi:hypothetical protein